MVGITIRVKKVETNRPDINVTAIGVKNELPDNARGKSPIIVVMVLSMIGLNLLFREDMHESMTESPSLIALLMCSSNILLLVKEDLIIRFSKSAIGPILE